MFRLLRRFASRFGRDDSPLGRALGALRAGDFAVAKRAFTGLIENGDTLGPKERALLFNKRGVARIGLGEREAARADFEAALEIVPRFAPALTNLGNLLLEDGRLGDAIAALEAAAAADEAYALAHFNLGIAYKRSGRIEDGVRELKRARTLEGRKPGRPTL